MEDTVTTECVLCAVGTSGLDPDESGVLQYMPPARREKLRRMKRREDRARSVCAELALQAAFSFYGVPPVVYGVNENGRPVMEPPWDLSLSHGGELAAAALSKVRVGVDTERRDRSFAALRRKICSTEEQNVPDEALCSLWTAKEAYLKMTGEGLRVSPGLLTVEGDWLLRGRKPAAVLKRFYAPEGYLITLASERPVDVRLHVLSWQEVLQRMEHRLSNIIRTCF